MTVTRRYALLGWPVRHSVSPEMQEAAFRAVNLPARYELVEVAPADLRATSERLRRAGYSGWNVTVPHKEQVLALLDEVDAQAAGAGSVNTVVNRDGRLCGYSTDGYGLATAVQESFGIRVPGGTFAFVGAGGAARATSVYFAQQGARALVLINRTLARAEALAAVIRAVAPGCVVDCVQLGDDRRVVQCTAGASALIQATSLGLHADDPLPLSLELVPAETAVMDMIYRTTPFLAAAAQRGCRTADGTGMLLHQGALSFRLWTGREAPLDVMREALARALAARAAQG